MKTIIAIIAAVIVIGIIGTVVVSYASTETVTITVKDKESVPVDNGNGGTKNEYRVTTDKGVFKVADTILKFRFDSADDYGKLDRGKTYECESFGFRLPLFSSFKNLIECKPVGA